MDLHVDDSLLALALGQLPEAERADVESHLAACARCARGLDETRETLALLPLALPAAVPPRAVRDRLLAAARPGGRFAAFADRLAAYLDVTLERARELLEGIDDPRSWTRGPVRGVRLYHFDAGPRHAFSIAGFVRMAPGTRFPRHSHLGRESGIVLQGTLFDDQGNVWHAGSEGMMELGSSHSFWAGDGEELIFVVTIEGGIEMNGRRYLYDDPDM